ncbi:MAG: hypothetical protein AMS27_17590 [Bacteroides sp. SM23_62_1]|nr:MAG: hypothetical protein AMS27_17590 [Bacteroides sp. SM23_62_1]
MMNKFILNPAVAGSDAYTSINLTAREQWIGFRNSPKTHALSAQTRILGNSYILKRLSIRKKHKANSSIGRVGVGGYVFNDRSGMVSRTGVQLTYAYHILLDNNQLSFGLSGTAYQVKIDKEDITVWDENDLLINNLDNILFIPDANIGVYYSTPQLYIGLSASQLFQASVKFGNRQFESYRLLRHYYLMGGYTVEINDYFSLEPNLLIKTSEIWNFQAEIGAKIYYLKDYWGGLTYRTDRTFTILGGVKIDKFFVGYAFDYDFASISKYSFGTHEFMLAVRFGEKARRYRWLNR